MVSLNMLFKGIPIGRNTIFSRFVRASMVIVLSVTLFGFLVISILRLSYERIIYEKSSELLEFTAAVIEREINGFEELTLTIATGTEIQNKLRELRESRGQSRWSTLRSDIGDAILRYDPMARYVASIRIYDEGGMEIPVGHDPYYLTREQISIMEEKTRAARGKPVLFLPGEINEYFIIARRILSTYLLELTHLGMVGIFIEFPLLLESYENLIEGYEMNIHVYNGNKLIGSTMPDIPLADVPETHIFSQGYQIISIGGKRMFIASIRSTGTRWTYYSTIPLSLIFQRLGVLSSLAAGVYLILMFGILLFAVSFSRKLTVPIRNLSKMMKKVETGNFNIDLDDKGFTNASDEVRFLHHDFNIALKKINELIEADFRKKIQIQEARFRILQTQINPHFLYNTLNSVNWMARQHGRGDISRIVNALGRLLRRSLGSTEKLVSLETELASLRDYLTIQKIRYEECLVVEIHIPEIYHNILVPPFLFQPLVENSIAYGLEGGTGYCHIRIHTKAKNGHFYVSINDDGPGFPSSVLKAFNTGKIIPTRHTGIGLSNIRERLQALFSAGRMELSNTALGAQVVMEFTCSYVKED